MRARLICLGCMAVVLCSSTACIETDTDADMLAEEDAAPVYVSDSTEPFEDPLAEKMAALSMACGNLSPNTVPGGWQQLLVTADGCTQWAPSSWNILGHQNDMLVAKSQQQTTASFVHVATLQGLDWALPSLNNHAMEIIEEEYGNVPEVIHYEETQVLGMPLANVVFTFQISGVDLVGYVRILFSGCIDLTQTCSAVYQGFWLPADSIEDDICTVVQIDASVKCPSGAGGCDATECQNQCVASGHTGGQCVGMQCQCF